MNEKRAKWLRKWSKDHVNFHQKPWKVMYKLLKKRERYNVRMAGFHGGLS
jgi:hypothetical protein